METWDAITARRNVREFADRAIPDADLDRVLEAGRIAPSSQNKSYTQKLWMRVKRKAAYLPG